MLQDIQGIPYYPHLGPRRGRRSLEADAFVEHRGRTTVALGIPVQGIAVCVALVVGIASASGGLSIVAVHFPLLLGWSFGIIVARFAGYVGFIPLRVIACCQLVDLPMVFTKAKDFPSYLHIAHVFVL
jgi:hypothetical protein